MYTLLALIDSSLLVRLYIVVGAILIFTGNNRIRSSSDDLKATGAFIAYGVLMIVYSIFLFIPLAGKLLSILIQIPAYIVLAIAFFRFSGNRIFNTTRQNGMILTGILALANIILAFVPTMLGISAFIFCVLEVPLLTIGFIMAVGAVQYSTKKVLGVPVREEKRLGIEVSPPVPVLNTPESRMKEYELKYGPKQKSDEI